MFRELVRGPGAWIVEGRDPQGRQVILQLSRLRTAKSPDEGLARLDYVRMIAAATEHLAQDPDLDIFAHGAVDHTDGSRILFWAMPWIEGADLLGHASESIDTPERLLAAARALLERVAERHERGRLEPLLIEHLVAPKPDGTFQLAGVPIHLPPEWLSKEMESARLSPEEQARSEPRRPGDLWRLGKAISALGSQLDEVPATITEFISRLSAPKAEQRPSSANEALAMLNSIEAGFDRERGLSAALDDGERRTEGVDALEPSDLSELSRGRDPGRGALGANAPATSQDLPRGEGHDTSPTPVVDLTEEPPLPAIIAPASFDRTVTDEKVELPELPPLRKPEPKEHATVRVPYPSPPEKKREPGARSDVPRAPSTIPESPTLLDTRAPRAPSLGDPKVNIPSARKPVATAPAFSATLVDEPRPELPEVVMAELRNLAEEEPSAPDPNEETLRDVPAARLENPDEDFPTMDDGLSKSRRRGGAPPTRRTVWDQAIEDSHAPPASTAAAAAAGLFPLGPPGPMGPRGTVVGVRLINDPTGIRERIRESPDLLPPPPGPMPALPSSRALLPAHTSDEIPVPTPRITGDLPPTVEGPRPELPSLPVIGQPPPVSRSNPPIKAPPHAVLSAAPAPSGKRRGVAIGAIGFFLAGGVAAFAGPYFLPSAKAPVEAEVTSPAEPAPAATAIRFAINPAGDVVLDALPDDALVIGEEDGRVLGTPPLRFLVPPGVGVAVLIAAPDHEPQRLILPDRGRLSTDLVPMPKARSCDLQLQVPGDLEFEAVGAEIEDNGAEHTIPGAAILRTARGRGAWLVRCPALGGTDPNDLPSRPVSKSARVELTGPEGAMVFLDGEPIGKAPISKTIETGFVLVRVEAKDGGVTERWVPVFHDTELRMPRPRGALDADEPAPDAKPPKGPRRRSGRPR